MAIDREEFGASFKDFIDQMRSQKTPEEAPFFVRKLRDHFGAEPSTLPVVSQPIPAHDHPNLHTAIEDYLAAADRSAEVLGVVGLNGFLGNGLADLVAPQSGFGSTANQGPVEYTNVELDGSRVVACVERGLFLVTDGDQRLAIFVRQDDRIASREISTVEVMAAEEPAWVPDSNGLRPRATGVSADVTSGFLRNRKAGEACPLPGTTRTHHRVSNAS
jgi:cell division protease FtsH